MAPAPVEPDEPDSSGQGGVPFGAQWLAPPASRWLISRRPNFSAGSQAGRTGGAGRRYGVVQAYDGDGIPVDPDPDWVSGRWDDSPEAETYWAELEASLDAALDEPSVDPLNGLLPREFFDDESCDRPADADDPELTGFPDRAVRFPPCAAGRHDGRAPVFSGLELLGVVGRQEPALMVYDEAACALVQTGRVLAWLEAHKFSLLNALYHQALDGQEEAWATPYEPEGRRRTA